MTHDREGVSGGKSPLGRADLQRYMDVAGIRGKIIDLPVATPTVAAAARALGVPENTIVKSILFVAEPDQAVLAIAPGSARIDRAAIAGWLGVHKSAVRLAAPEEALEVCGYEVGAVPPFGHRQVLPVCMDRALRGVAAVHAGGGAMNSLLRIDPGEIARATGAEFIDLVRDAEGA